jgi:hypothetical protein
MHLADVKTIQIRNVPEELALSELRRSLERPTRRELLDRIPAQEPVEIPGGAAALIRKERDSR